MNRLNILPENPDAKHGRFPSWLHRQLPRGGALSTTHAILHKHQLNTVCEEAKCPNRLECYAKQTATFLILGKACTRNCGFCDIDFSKQPKPPELDEPDRVARAVFDLGLKHVVITMVARDDLDDGGALHVAATLRAIRSHNQNTTIEVLSSDFNGNLNSLDIVLREAPEIFNHNLETVRSLTPRVRHRATYDRTLAILRHAKSKISFVKSGLMVGLGETAEEVYSSIRDLHAAGCSIITIGHYLQPNRRKLLVKAFISPEQFKAYEEYGLSLGVKHMYCGPFVRSSYNALMIKDRLIAHE